jgi:alpha-tubulin suppressor-like RCC1 family protein
MKLKLSALFLILASSLPLTSTDVFACGTSQESPNIIRTSAPIFGFSSPCPPDNGGGEGEVTPTLTLSLTDLPQGRVSTSYSFDFKNLVSWSNLPEGTAEPSIVWSATTALPAGLLLNSSTGRLSGMPTEEGLKAFSIRATSTTTDSKTYSLQIKGEIQIELASATVPAGKINTTFNYDFTPLATWKNVDDISAQPTITWATMSPLPNGLSLSPSGILSGTPTDIFDKNVLITATGGSINQDKAYRIVISGNNMNAISLSMMSSALCGVQVGGGLLCRGAPSYVSSSSLGAVVDAVSITTNMMHGCYISTGGKGRCFGYNASGQLGNNTINSTSTIRDVSAITPTNISAGRYHTCAVSAGLVYCWGENNGGQLGTGNTTDYSYPVSTGVSAIQVSAGAAHSCAVNGAGVVKCWGNNPNGQLGNNSQTTSYTAVTSVLPSAKKVATGLNHSCAILTDDTLYCWGSNLRGQIGDGTSGNNKRLPQIVPGVSGASALALGDNHTCAVTNGNVMCWGYNTNGQLGMGDTISRLSPAVVPGVSNAIDVVALDNGTCALLANNEISCWGANLSGRFVTGGSTDILSPTIVSN